MKNKFDQDLNTLCRLCLNKGSELRPIFNCDVNFSYRIKSCVGIELHQFDPGPTNMCINCMSHIENWEGFKQKCVSANEFIHEYLKRLEDDKSNVAVDKTEKFDVKQEAEKNDDNYNSMFNNELNNHDSDNDLFKSRSPISITAREVYPRAVKRDGKVSEVTNTITTNRKKRYECGMCSSIGFTEKDLLYNHLIDTHSVEDNNTPHYCLICNKGYCSFKIYQEHLTAKQEIHGTIQIQDKTKDCIIGCGLCSCKFSRSTSLYRHLRNHGLKKDLVPYVCSFCQVGFLDKHSLCLHASTDNHTASVTVNEPDEDRDGKPEPADRDRSNSDGGPEKEDHAQATMSGDEGSARDGRAKLAIATKRRIKTLRTVEDKRAKYREHYRRFQSKTYACEFCDGVTYTRFCDLSNHDRTAHDDMAKEFGCPTCGKLFLTDGRLQIHRDAFHAAKAFGCDVCHVRCKSKHTLRTHMRKHSGAFACPHCHLTTASNAALVSHVRVHTGEKPFVCDMCGNSYASKLGLTSHERTHAREPLFRCNVCGYTGSSHSSIYVHRQTHNADKPYVCDVCGKTFKIKVRLVDHQKIHFAAKKYVCDVCDKAFLARYQLVQHSRTHSGEKPFACHMCAKSFARRDGLSEHIRTHTGEKRYTCPGCFGTFSFYKTMKNHKCSAAGKHPQPQPQRCDDRDRTPATPPTAVGPSTTRPCPAAGSASPVDHRPSSYAAARPVPDVVDHVASAPCHTNGQPVWQSS